MDLIPALRRILTADERRMVRRVLGIAILTAVVQTLAVFSIMPFMALVTGLGGAPGAQVLSDLGRRVGIDDPRRLFIAAGGLVLTFVLVANTLGALSLRRVHLVAWNIHHYMSQRLLSIYLRLPYLWSLDRHTARLGQNLLGEVGMVVQAALVPLMTAAVRGMESLLIVGMLLVLDPVLTLASGAAIGGAYVVIFLAARRLQERLGKERARTDERRYRLVVESLGGVKEIKSLGAEQEFIRRFGETGPSFVHAKAWSQVIAELPRYLLEVLSLGTVLAIFLGLVLWGTSLEAALPKLVLFGFAGYKLVPSLHQVFAALSQTRFAMESVRTIEEHFRLAGDVEPMQAGSPGTLPFERSLEFRDTSFAYPKTEAPALRALSFSIAAGEFIGVVGPTGSGKTTLVDVMLGLLVPQGGQILVDGRPLDLATAGWAWRQSIGYVPQSIFLSDDTITRNIAFGVRDDDIDHERVRLVARHAQVAEFVDELPNGFDTPVGERGVRLSGGQRQRIGLARALYRDPPLLLLDEATSALDGATEASVMSAIYGLERERTVVVVAHRLQTVDRCDRILLLDRGCLVDQGTFAQLRERNDLFRVMARGVDI